MKLIRIAEPGRVMNQPKGKPSSGKMDSQIFLEKEDPSHAAKKKRKKKGKEKKQGEDAGKCSVCTAKRK